MLLDLNSFLMFPRKNKAVLETVCPSLPHCVHFCTARTENLVKGL